MNPVQDIANGPLGTDRKLILHLGLQAEPMPDALRKPLNERLAYFAQLTPRKDLRWSSSQIVITGALEKTAHEQTVRAHAS